MTKNTAATTKISPKPKPQPQKGKKKRKVWCGKALFFCFFFFFLTPFLLRASKVGLTDSHALLQRKLQHQLTSKYNWLFCLGSSLFLPHKTCLLKGGFSSGLGSLLYPQDAIFVMNKKSLETYPAMKRQFSPFIVKSPRIQ